MEFPSKLIEQAVGEVSKLPNIGKKTALRLVLHLLKKDETHTLALADALVNLRTHVQYCQQCHNLSDAPLCALCANPHRDHALVCVVQDIRDVMAIENTGQYRGLYHVLGGIISPVEGIGPNDLNVESLVQRVALAAPPADHLAERAPDYGTPAPEPVKEIIFALSATMEGDTTAFYLTKRLRPYGVRVSTISRGVPVGGDLEFADEITLGRSIVSRINYE